MRIELSIFDATDAQLDLIKELERQERIKQADNEKAI